MANSPTKKAGVRTRPKPVVLLVVDGLPDGQPFSFDKKMPKLQVLLKQGWYAGLPLKGTEPLSIEDGYQLLGGSRILLDAKSLASNTLLKKSLANTAKGTVHVLGSIGIGADGRDQTELFIQMFKYVVAQDINRVALHLFIPEISADEATTELEKLGRALAKQKKGHLYTIMGMDYAGDRDDLWPRTERAYNAIMTGVGDQARGGREAVAAFEDESVSMKPRVISRFYKPVDQSDLFIFVNSEGSAFRQLLSALALPDFLKFDRPHAKLPSVLTLRDYQASVPVESLLGDAEQKRSLGRRLADAGLKQLRVSETMRFGHVTSIFNGGDQTLAGQTHELIQSDQSGHMQVTDPEMKSGEIAAAVVRSANTGAYDFILASLPNIDVITKHGKPDDLSLAIQAVDAAVATVIKDITDIKGVVVISSPFITPATKSNHSALPLFVFGSPDFAMPTHAEDISLAIARLLKLPS